MRIIYFTCICILPFQWQFHHDSPPKIATNTHANMERCFKSVPKKSYNKYCYMLLGLFVSIVIIVIGIAAAFDLKTTLQCNPDKTIASDLSTRKFVETQCFLKYAQKFHPSSPLCSDNNKFWTCAPIQYYLRSVGERSCGNLCRSSQYNDEFEWRRRWMSATLGYFTGCIGPYGEPKSWWSYYFHGLHYAFDPLPYNTISCIRSIALNFVQFSSPIWVSLAKANHEYFPRKLETKWKYELFNCALNLSYGQQ
jgi:hypothetical protein